MHYTHILFDLDGTLTDSGPGIMNGFEYAITKMGGTVEDKSQLKRFVGPPLEESFGTMLGYSPEDTVKAIATYREYYFQMGGVLENEVYPGVVKLLEDIKVMGLHSAVATSKFEKGTMIVLDHFDLTRYFDVIGCGNDTDRKAKKDIIRYVINAYGITDLSKVLMVGDRHYDIDAAREIGIDSVGVLYGYGNEEEFKKAGATYIVARPEDIINLL
ncbi:MAG: HAD-IA family hydrolase [Lachnospiraceae bacterium]|nr:HAD-IA family hydrolase [Lachnospiraceae bacterium]